MHVPWEGASGILVIVPLFRVGQAYRQTRSPRLLFAFLAFAVLELRFAVAVAIHSVIVVDHTFEETVGFLTDLIAIALFAAAFLYATGLPHGRVGSDLACTRPWLDRGPSRVSSVVVSAADRLLLPHGVI